jgi:site-specific DNA-cytosine methylase
MAAPLVTQLTFRTLCTGAGLFDIGARLAGWTHVDGWEIRSDIAAMAQRIGFHVHAQDVRTVDWRLLVPVRHLHSSPSCKNASKANKNAGETEDDLSVADALVRAIWAHAAQGGLSFSLENVVGYRWFESFDRIVAALAQLGWRFATVAKGGEKPKWRTNAPQWNDAGVFVDMADYGVPQNRKRLILVAVSPDWRPNPPFPLPTHSKRGGVLLQPWRGWFGAIAYRLDELPRATLANWQIARLPAELRETLLLNNSGYHGDVTMRPADDPAFTLTADRNHRHLRMLLVSGGNTNLSQVDSLAREGDAPAPTITSSDGAKKVGRIVLVGEQRQRSGTLLTREADEAAPTVRATAGTLPRVLLLNAQNGSRQLTLREPEDPAFTTPASAGKGMPQMLLIDAQHTGQGEHISHEQDQWSFALHASLNQAYPCVVEGGLAIDCRSLDRRALMDLMSVPRDIPELPPEYNGNGVPPLFAQQMMETLR